MNAPPAFQFYPDDFIGGTVDLSPEDCGSYIRLLCYQWGRGQIPADRVAIARVCGCQPSEEVMAKFPDRKNARLERERQKQIEYKASQSNSGKVGAEKRWGRHSEPIVSPMANGMAKNSSPSPSPSPLLEREREFPEIPPMSRKDYDSLADLRGIPKDCSEWFWNACDGRNWTDKHGQPIRKVEPLLINAAKNWRAIETNRKQANGKWQKPEQTVDDILRKLL